MKKALYLLLSLALIVTVLFSAFPVHAVYDNYESKITANLKKLYREDPDSPVRAMIFLEDGSLDKIDKAITEKYGCSKIEYEETFKDIEDKDERLEAIQDFIVDTRKIASEIYESDNREIAEGLKIPDEKNRLFKPLFACYYSEVGSRRMYIAM